MVSNCIFLAHVIFVLGGLEKGQYGIVSLKVYLYAYFVAGVSEVFNKSFYVWHYYISGYRLIMFSWYGYFLVV